jgi:hypothetical protein
MYLPGKPPHVQTHRMEVHDSVHHSIFQQLGRMKQSSKACTEREAIQELLQSAVSYSGDDGSTTVRSYQRDLVSLPDCGASPIPMDQVIDSVGRDMLKDPLASMLLSEDEFGQLMEDGDLIRPYMDVVLQNDSNQYQQFVRDLHDKGMIDFTDHPADLVTPFFVRKKNNRLRFILDCRQVNRRFQSPPPLALAAGSSWSNLVMPEKGTLYVAQSDIKDYFYSLALPEQLQPLFCLPPIPCHLVEAWNVDPKLRFGSGVNGQLWPRLRVVPMGWSWAMYLSQRIHQNLVLESTGLDPSRLLIDGVPPPSLEGGEVAIIPYADNLNVAGLDQDRVQHVKDTVVAKLRATGFRVHEELDATDTAQSLGFYIDGVSGVVSPIPERLQLVLKAFAWLAKRPRVKGKAVEKLLGHAVHFCMLRRDLLSIFRSLYDFIHHSYDSRSKLWGSAAKEARWASHLLKLCSVKLRRCWSSDVTSSDASLSGIAVSRRSLDVSLQSLVGSVKESWRYKTNNQVKPRETALKNLDPFSNPETVKPLAKIARDPFVLDEFFPEVPDEVMAEDSWHDVFSIHMQRPEHITLLEGRGIVAALRHKLRSKHEFGKKHLHFNDNMSVVLLCSKGRSGSFGMLRVCRRIAALSLCADILLVVRWIPSEKNVSDKGSRRWEHLRLQHAENGASKKQKKAIVDHVCYEMPLPWNVDSRADGGSEEAAPEGPSENFHSEESPGEDQLSKAEGGRKARCFSLSGADDFREGCGLRARGSGLSEKDGGPQGLRKGQESQSVKQEEVRRGLLLVSEQFVRARLRSSRRIKNFSSHRRQPPRVFKQEPIAQDPQSFAGMGKAGAAANQASFALGSGVCHGDPDVEHAGVHSSGSNTLDVLRVPSSRRMSGSTDLRLSEASSGNAAFCSAPAPCRKKRAVKGGALRREPPSGQSSNALVGGGAFTAASNKYGHVRHHLQPHGKHLEENPGKVRAQHKSRSTISAKALRTISRPAVQITQSPGSETKRKVECRCVGQTIRSACSSEPRISCPAQVTANPVPEKSAGLGDQGPKAFWPSVKAFSQPRYVLEIFSGCARLSRAMASHGFVSFAYDIIYNDACDLLQTQNLQKLLAWIERHAHEIALVWLGTPYTSWSRARKHDGIGPPPLRDDSTFLMSGLPGLKSRDVTKVQEGNALLDVSKQIISQCKLYNIAFVLENPWTSRLWLTPTIRSFLDSGAQLHQVDYCAFNMPWRKSTGLMQQGFPTLSTILKICHPHFGRCQFSNHRHLHLTGKDSNNSWLTLRAQPYPPMLCNAIASTLAASQGTRESG